MKKIGIMGGTFNPIHYGHLFLAENSYDQIGLDQVLFMPSKNPPHKVIAGNISDQHRTDMISLAIEDNPHFVLSTMELHREGITYTADTLSILTKEHPDEQYYFIVGADSFLMMQNWMEPQRIFHNCIVVAAGRDDVEKDQLYQHDKRLKDMFDVKTIILDMPIIQISSVIVRERITENKSIRYYLPNNVIEYIAEKKLYLTH